MAPATKYDFIKSLDLVPHREEGGYYRQVYVAPFRYTVTKAASNRPSMDTIYYMLTDDSPTGWFHRNRSDIVHFFHCGHPIQYFLLFTDGRIEAPVLGPEPALGHKLQLAVPSGVWKGSELMTGDFGLISEAVTPAFDPAEREIATETLLGGHFELLGDLRRLVRP